MGWKGYYLSAPREIEARVREVQARLLGRLAEAKYGPAASGAHAKPNPQRCARTAKHVGTIHLGLIACPFYGTRFLKENGRSPVGLLPRESPILSKALLRLANSEALLTNLKSTSQCRCSQVASRFFSENHTRSTTCVTSSRDPPKTPSDRRRGAGSSGRRGLPSRLGLPGSRRYIDARAGLCDNGWAWARPAQPTGAPAPGESTPERSRPCCTTTGKPSRSGPT